jgi:hypothetical protein
MGCGCCDDPEDLDEVQQPLRPVSASSSCSTPPPKINPTINISSTLPVVLLPKPYQTDHHRIKVDLGVSDPSFDGTGDLTFVNGTKIKVYTAATGGGVVAQPINIQNGPLIGGHSIYIQGLQSSGTMEDIELTLTITGANVGPAVKKKITCGDLKLEIFKVRPENNSDPIAIAEDKKNDPGGIVHLQNNHKYSQRIKMVVHKAKPDNYTGNIVLSKLDGKVKVFDQEDPAGGTEQNLPFTIDNSTIHQTDGKEFWVEGATVSGALQDTNFQLKVENLNQDGDQVKFTCIELKLTIHKGIKQATVAPDAISDSDKISKGRFLHVQDSDKHGRALMTVALKPAAASGTLAFTVGDGSGSKDNSKLKIFNAETGGSAKANPYEVQYASDLKLWAEGAGESAALRDIEIRLGMKDVTLVADKAKATVVKIKEVTPTADNYKQYVNVPAEAGHPEYDRKFKPIATLTKALQGVKLYFNIEPDSSNNADIPDTLKHKDIADNTRVAVETNVSGAASGAIELSRYGGDKFKAAAYLEEDPLKGKANPTKSKDIEVWQKIAYQYDAMQTNDTNNYIATKDTNAFETEFKKYFIEMNKIAETTPAHRRAIANSENDAWVASNKSVSFPGARAVYIGLVDTVGGSPRTEITLTFNSKVGGATHNFDIQNQVIDISSKNLWLVSVKCRDTSPPNAEITLDQGKVALAQNNHDYKLTLDLTALSGTKNYDIEFKFNSYPPVSGLSWGEKVLIDVRFRYKYGHTVHDSVLNTVLHEVAHFLGLAAQKNTDNAGTIYSDYYLQSGNHCKHLVNQCIMYHASMQANLVFCPMCGKALRARDLSSPPIWGTADF